MNIYIHEFKAGLRGVLTWSIALVALILLYMSLYQSFAADAALLTDMMSKFPPQLLQAFGITGMDFTTLIGFYGLIFVFIQICLAIQAANYGFSLVAVEETEWTADFLLSKPVGRPKIMTIKLLAALTGLAITQVVVWISSFVFINLYAEGKEIPTAPLVLLLLSMIVFQLFFLTVGMAISLLVKRIRSITPYSMGLVFGLYILKAFGEMFGEKGLEIISPFNHFAPGAIINNEAWDTPLVMISVVVIVASLAASYVLYAKRNILSPV